MGFRLGHGMSAPLAFIPTRAAALARLVEFIPVAGRYGAERNFVRPGHPNVSRLSPWMPKCNCLPRSKIWWAHRDLNPEPRNYEFRALTVEL